MFDCNWSNVDFIIIKILSRDGDDIDSKDEEVKFVQQNENKVVKTVYSHVIEVNNDNNDLGDYLWMFDNLNMEKRGKEKVNRKRIEKNCQSFWRGIEICYYFVWYKIKSYDADCIS